MQLEGLIPIFGGVYAYLLATGRVQAGKDPVKNEIWRKRFGPMMKILGPFLVVFGIIQLCGLLK